ncbi:PAS domain S-box protein [Natronomonas halophila]|uniref:two-component system sensor histidine kinase NtrB n=1 Tax=Natronomonas halophila TaxID=2747817 RepID=UPI0015B433BB|nr:HAMP domain-containing sensor histidine kinase [Natronomonas halophila]QLD86576.1 PAS domain S-box protein [Natronomonas halophila]
MGRDSTLFANLGRRLFEKAVEASGHSVYFTDRNGVIQYVNPAFEEVTGYTAAEAVGKTPRILKSGEHDEAFYEELWETILAGDVWRNELINRRKSGERYVVDQTIAPVEDDGEITHFVAINVDITDQHDYERRLERQNERLDEFASVVSHDLNNMLTVASGNTELARETGDHSRLDRVEEAHDRMQELTDELLTLARSGQAVENEQAVSLVSAAKEAWSTTATADATLACEDDVDVVADRERLRQLFENLFRNAVEHGSTSPRSSTREDAVEHGSTSPPSRTQEDAIECGSASPSSSSRTDAVEHGSDPPASEPPTGGDAKRDGDGVTVRVGVDDDTIYVADDGVGIDPDERTEVFEKGYTTDDDGNGYGLTIVRNIAEAHGWGVNVTESSAGGARFEITDAEFDA